MKRKFIDNINSIFKEELNLLSDDDGLEAIIYGIRCNKIYKGKAYDGIICISEKSESYLKYIDRKLNEITEFEISRINSIEFKNNTENLKGYTPKTYNETFFQIFENDQINDFSFNSKRELIYFLKGIVAITSNIKFTHTNYVERNINKIMGSYNEDFDEVLDKEEFTKFAEEMGLDPEMCFEIIDSDNSKTISKSELTKFFKDKMNGEQFKNVFLKYSHDGINLKPEELQLLFKEMQNEPINILEANLLVARFLKGPPYKLRRKIESKIQKKYIKNGYSIDDNDINTIIQKINEKNNTNIIMQLTLTDINNLFNSLLLKVYNKKLLKEPLDLGRPLVDYFISSSHNTYLKGHQLKGESSVIQYKKAVMNGYRLVELDCYNGSGDSIEVTHGYTLVSKLYLVDILKILREYSFVNSPLPVILSIENHLDKKHQEIMAKNLKEILIDIYIFPYNKKPDYIPTLKDLLNKFIVKCGGKRLWVNQDIPCQNYIPMVNENDDDDKLKKLILNEDNYDDVIDSDDENDNNRLRSKPKIDNKNIQENNKEEENEDKIESSKIQPEKSPKKKDEDKEKEIEETEYITNLENCRGLCGTKLVYENLSTLNLKKWEFVTLKSSKYENEIFEDYPMRKNITELSTHCMMKAYPQKFDSSNYNIIKCWTCGCQVAAINIQDMEEYNDDFTLFNQVFFLQNQNYGYILKPKKLLPESFKLEIYDRPKIYVQMQIISVFNLAKLVNLAKIKKTDKPKINILIYALDVIKGETFKINLSDGLIFPTIELHFPIQVPFYEKDLGGLMIKFTYNDKTIGRGCIPLCMMKEGYRRIPIYCNRCKERRCTYVVGYFKIYENDEY